MIGPQDIWVALALGIFFFGAKKLPELSRSLGQALSEFKKGVAAGADTEAAASAAPAQRPVQATPAPQSPEDGPPR